MSSHDFDEARAIHEALLGVFSRKLGGKADREALELVTKLCDAAVGAVNDVDCRVAIRSVKHLSTLLYSDDGHADVEVGSLRGTEALRFQILNALSNFRGRLDVLEATYKPSRPEKPALEQRRRLRVVIIEDNRDAADTLSRLLETCGHTVKVAYNGRDGLELATRTKPDVVVCDIGLPDGDGFSVAEAMRKNPSMASTRLIAVTGYGTDIDRARSKKAGFQLHLVKPVSPTTLIEELEADRTQRSTDSGTQNAS
jgi:CheY-like chemotaxis protein